MPAGTINPPVRKRDVMKTVHCVHCLKPLQKKTKYPETTPPNIQRWTVPSVRSATATSARWAAVQCGSFLPRGSLESRAVSYDVSHLFEMVFAQYIRTPESKSLAPDGTASRAETCGLLGRYPVTASGFHLIGKETERGWEQSEDISTLLPSLVHYQDKSSEAVRTLQKTLQETSLSTLQRRTGLSRHTILRARQGERVRPRSLRRLQMLLASDVRFRI
jgi:hypothetical protein